MNFLSKLRKERKEKRNGEEGDGDRRISHENGFLSSDVNTFYALSTHLSVVEFNGRAKMSLEIWPLTYSNTVRLETARKCTFEWKKTRKCGAVVCSCRNDNYIFSTIVSAKHFNRKVLWLAIIDHIFNDNDSSNNNNLQQSVLPCFTRKIYSFNSITDWRGDVTRRDRMYEWMNETIA